ncbi:hypothetical protein AB5N96_08235 [Chryseomicrobium imtechense]
MKKFKKWYLTLATFGGFLGVVIGTFIFNDGDISAILGAATGLLIIFLINLIYVKSKKDNTPEIDERTRNNMRTYYAVVGNVFMGVLFLALTALSYAGESAVSLSYLWMFVIAYMLISGIGALVVSKR